MKIGDICSLKYLAQDVIICDIVKDVAWVKCPNIGAEAFPVILSELDARGCDDLIKEHYPKLKEDEG
jgi:hypothetical protein